MIARGRLDELVADQESHREMIAELERRHDEATADGDIPTTDDLASQVEQFLREQENE